MILCGCMTIPYFRSLRHSASVGTKIASAFSFIFHDVIALMTYF